MHAVSSLIRNHFIGVGKSFPTQLNLAQKAGIRPSTMTSVLKAGQVEPETLGKRMSAMSARQRDLMCAAAVRDALPKAYAGLVFKGGKVAVRDDAAASLLSPLARKTLEHLGEEAVRDPMTQEWLEKQGQWMGLDK